MIMNDVESVCGMKIDFIWSSRAKLFRFSKNSVIHAVFLFVKLTRSLHFKTVQTRVYTMPEHLRILEYLYANDV